MARLISGGRGGMRTHMYGTMSQETVNYLQNQINSLTTHFGDTALQWQQELQSKFNSGALRDISIARSNLEYSGNLFDDGVSRLRSTDDFRTTSLLNQFLMNSHPYFAQEVQSGRLEGWNLDNKYPGLTGERNPIYQSVISGNYQYGDEDWFDDESPDKMVIYYNEEVDNEKNWHQNELMMIKQNWNTLYNLINSIEEEVLDPTSISGNYL